MFKPLMWSYRFDELDIERHKKTIIVNTVTHGLWGHWQWLFATYGKKELKKVIQATSASEFTFFNPAALKLFGIILKV